MSNFIKVILSCVLGTLMYAFYIPFQPRIILTRDSTMAPNQESTWPEMGWREALPDLEIKPVDEASPLLQIFIWIIFIAKVRNKLFSLKNKQK